MKAQSPKLIALFVISFLLGLILHSNTVSLSSQSPITLTEFLNDESLLEDVKESENPSLNIRDNSNPPIIIITIETVRSDHSGRCYNYTRPTMPNLCELAQDGVLFENAYAQGSHTRMSIPIFEAGITPRGTGYKDRNMIGGVIYSDKITTFGEILSRKGYDTVTTNEAEELRREGAIQGFSKTTEGSNVAEIVDSRTAVWYLIRESAHSPYAPKSKFRLWDNFSAKSEDIEESWVRFKSNSTRQELINLYDADIRAADHRIGKLIAQLKQKQKYNDSLIIVTSDHGEAFGEHEMMAWHTGIPYNEKLKVPLVIKFPKGRNSGKRVVQPVRQVDVVPTLFHYLNITQDVGKVGKSLFPAIEGRDMDLTIFAAATSDRDWSLQKQIKTLPFGKEKSYKYILRNVEEVCKEEGKAVEMLFNLEEDPREQSNIASNTPVLTGYLRRKTCRFYQSGENFSVSKNRNLSKKLKKRIKNLGYK